MFVVVHESIIIKVLKTSIVLNTTLINTILASYGVHICVLKILDVCIKKAQYFHHSIVTYDGFGSL